MIAVDALTVRYSHDAGTDDMVDYMVWYFKSHPAP